jgi:hypothetical protein
MSSFSPRQTTEDISEDSFPQTDESAVTADRPAGPAQTRFRPALSVVRAPAFRRSPSIEAPTIEIDPQSVSDERVAQLGIDRAKRIVLGAFARAAMFAVLLCLPVALLWVDVKWMQSIVGETSATEFGQLGLLTATALAFIALARGSEPDRRFATLVAGFFGCMLIRESDAYLDLIMDDLWQISVALIAGACLFYALKDWRSTLRSMARFVASRPGLVMILGLVLLLVYSRLFGMSSLWKGMLGDGYQRVFKNAVEEGTEVLGYALILVAALTYVVGRLRRLQRQ